VLAWLLPLILLIPFSNYSQLAQPEGAFRLVGQTLLPQAAESMLAVFLAVTGGPVASLAIGVSYRPSNGSRRSLPNLPWMAAAFVGVLVRC